MNGTYLQRTVEDLQTSEVSLQERLLHGYRAQLAHFDRAAEVLDNAGSEPLRDNHWAHELHASLVEAAKLDAAMAPDMAAWRASGARADGPLREIFEQLTKRIQTLSDNVDLRIGQIRSQKQTLVTESDEFIQERRMLQAYAKNRQ
jgi:hypothetical protein